ncbi:hypothetical protein Tco_1375542 [Tanacetum coccineum]
MSVEEVEQIVAKQVANAIETIAIYESINQGKQRENKVVGNASNKRKWEGDHNGSFSQQQNKVHKVFRAHTIRLSNKEDYAGNLPWHGYAVSSLMDTAYWRLDRVSGLFLMGEVVMSTFEELQMLGFFSDGFTLILATLDGLDGSGIETIVYADSDHAGDYVDRKSTSGVCTFMGCCLTSWFSKKQTALAISTTEAEYVTTVI